MERGKVLPVWEKRELDNQGQIAEEEGRKVDGQRGKEDGKIHQYNSINWEGGRPERLLWTQEDARAIASTYRLLKPSLLEEMCIAKSIGLCLSSVAWLWPNLRRRRRVQKQTRPPLQLEDAEVNLIRRHSEFLPKQANSWRGPADRQEAEAKVLRRRHRGVGLAAIRHLSKERDSHSCSWSRWWWRDERGRWKALRGCLSG